MNSMCLIGKPMLLLNTILMRISPLNLPFLHKIAPHLKFDTTSSSSSFMVTLTVMLFLLFSMIFGPFYVDSHGVCAGTWNQLLCQVLPFVVAVPIRATRSAKRRLQTSQSPIEINGSVLFVEGIMCDSLRVKLNRTRESKDPCLTPTVCPGEFF